jgi:membrane associated rhomboid family serine protease
LGLYDRDYLRDEYEQPRRGFSFPAPQSMTVALIIVNVVLYLLNFLFFPPSAPNADWLTTILSASNLTLTHPFYWWQFLTCGFVHASPGHIFFNMLQLYFLGKYVEDIYGRWEFLRLYLLMIVVGSLLWAIGNAVFPPPPGRLVLLLGASGAISGVVMLFVLHYPQATLTLFPIPIPVKAWVMGLLLILMNVLGAVSQFGNTAWSVHLAGIAVAFLYFRGRWHFGSLFQNVFHKPKFLSRPKLRVHKPDADDSEPLDLNDEVDRILEKIHQHGESSLTKQERRLLEVASRKYQKRRKD